MPATPQSIGEAMKDLHPQRKVNPHASALEEAGVVTINIADPEGQATESAAINQSISQRQRIWIDGIPNVSNMELLSPSEAKELEKTLPASERDIYHTSLEFRYPPKPPVGGFNIFGPINYLRMTSASGKLMIGDAPHETTNGDLEFRGIKGFDVEGGVISVPIKTSKDTADFQVKATSYVNLNGESLNKRSDAYSFPFAYLALLFSGVQALARVALMLKPKKPNEPTTSKH